MFLPWWRNAPKQKAKSRSRSRFFRFVGVELLEDRTLLSTFQWTGSANALWNNPNNWTNGPVGAFPSAQGDVAQFTGTITGSTLVTVNQAITVGEIDFNNGSSITIGGPNVLTLDNTGGVGGNAILSLAGTNAGVDVIAAPIAVAGATPLQATISGGTLQLTNTNTGAGANAIGSSSSFT